jgi:hypothetical protein
VQLSCTQDPVHRVYDMWAWAPMPEVEPSVAAKLRGAQPQGGRMPLVQWLTSLTAGCGGDEKGV